MSPNPPLDLAEGVFGSLDPLNAAGRRKGQLVEWLEDASVS